MDDNTRLVHDVLRAFYGWPNLLSIAVFTGLAWWSGWASLRLLRRVPDFPGKDEMRRGARWGGLGLVGLFFLIMVVQIACMALLPWKTTVLVSHQMISAIVVAIIAVLVGKRLDPYLPGLVMWRAPYDKPFATGFISRRPFDIYEWLAWREARREHVRASRWWRVGRWAVVVMLAFSVGSWLWMIHWVSRLDRDIAEQARLEKLAANLKAEMNDPQVTELEFHGKMTSMERGPSWPATALAKLQPHASQPEAEQVAQRIEGFLSRHHERQVWSIWVQVERSRIRVREEYDPRTGQTGPMPTGSRSSAHAAPASAPRP